MSQLCIVVGLIATLLSAWMAGDERLVCRASSARSKIGGPTADRTIRASRWGGAQVSREDTALSVLAFSAHTEREPAADRNDRAKFGGFIGVGFILGGLVGLGLGRKKR